MKMRLDRWLATLGAGSRSETRQWIRGGQAAVNGTTDLRPAAEREQANQLMEHTLTNIAASGNAAKEAIEQQYLENKDELTQKRRNLYERKAQEISKAF